MTDHLSQAGASALAERIRTYWAERGHDVATRVEPLKMQHNGCDRGKPIHQVRSDMIAGQPRKATARAWLAA